MSLQLHYTGQDYLNRGLAGGTLTPGSTSAIVGGCKTGKGFEFDGTENSALYVNNIGISMPTKFTVSCWVKVTATGENTIFSNGGVQNSGFVLDIANNYARTYSYNTSNTPKSVISTPGTIQLNIWYHLTAGMDGNRIFLYLNGSFIGESTITGTIRANFSPIIGYRYVISPFNGQICNFKYYNHVLSQKEINEDYKSLIIHYPLNKAITDTVYDASGFQNNGEIIGDITLGEDFVLYENSACFSVDELNTPNGYIDCGFKLQTAEQTISCFFKLSDITLTSYPTLIDNISDAGYLLWYIKSSQRLEYVIIKDTQVSYDYSYLSYTLNQDNLNDKLHHIAVTYDGFKQKMYLDGILVASKTVSTTHTPIKLNSSRKTYVGKRGYNNYPFSGNMQDVRIYATALTEDDVKDLYNVRHSIDKQGNYYTYELIEGETSVGMKKSGQTNCDEFIEEDGIFRIKNNLTIKAKNLKEI